MHRLLSLLIFMSYASVLFSKPPSTLLLDKDVDKLIALYSDGLSISYPEARHIQLCNFFSNESKDAVALFSIEGFDGGNYHAEYIAYFQGVDSADSFGKKSKPFRLIYTTKIGGRGWRTFDWKTIVIKQGNINLKGMKWSHKDPACCPSISFKTTFRIKDDSIIEDGQ